MRTLNNNVFKYLKNWSMIFKIRCIFKVLLARNLLKAFKAGRLIIHLFSNCHLIRRQWGKEQSAYWKPSPASKFLNYLGTYFSLDQQLAVLGSFVNLIFKICTESLNVAYHEPVNLVCIWAYVYTPKVCVIWKVDDAHHVTPEITNHLCRRAPSVVISGHVTRHVVDFLNYTDFSSCDFSRLGSLPKTGS